MAFRRFEYHKAAEQGLSELYEMGDDVFAELKRKIRTVQDSWTPEEEGDPLLVVPFLEYYLTFTASPKDRSILILADVRRQPEG